MTTTIKNITMLGAAGSLGSAILDRLVASGKFNIRALKRVGSKSTFPAGIDGVEVDFTSPDSLKSALAGQDAVVSAVGMEGIESQLALIDAAATVGVKRFIPSEFGSNLENPNTRKLPVFVAKMKVQTHLIETCEKTDLTYTLVYNNAFLDWGIERDFLLSTRNSKPIIIDGGDLPFSATTLSSVGDAVVGVMSHPDETKNRAVYVHDLVTTQNKLLSLATKAAPSKEWTSIAIKIDDQVAKANERLAKGIYDQETFVPYLMRAVLDPNYGGKFEKTDNELLGVKGKTDEDVIELFRKHLN